MIIEPDLASLFRDRADGLRLYFATRLPDPMEADDYVQTAFEKIAAFRGRIREPSKFLTVVAHTLLWDAHRHSKTHPRDASWEALIGPKGSGLDEYPRFQSPDFEDSDFAAEFDRAVRVLEPSLRDPFILGELRGLPSRESAPHLGVSHVTVAARRELATSLIRKELTHVQ